MIGLVMAGGRGSRMKMPQEKLLLRYKKPVVLHVLDALRDSGCFSEILAATSPNSPRTRMLLVGEGHKVIDTPGDGYSEDLNYALRRMDGPVFVASADMPLLDGEAVRGIVRRWTPGAAWTSVLVTEKFLGSAGLSPGIGVDCAGTRCSYTGISLVDSSEISGAGRVPEDHLVLDDGRIAFNMNTRRDYESLGAA